MSYKLKNNYSKTTKSFVFSFMALGSKFIILLIFFVTITDILFIFHKCLLSRCLWLRNVCVCFIMSNHKTSVKQESDRGNHRILCSETLQNIIHSMTFCEEPDIYITVTATSDLTKSWSLCLLVLIIIITIIIIC